MSALGPLLTKLSKKEDVDRVTLIATLSDTARLLMDLQREEKLTRRLIIIVSNLNPSIEKTLITINADEWLFNKDLAETMKTEKSLEKASNDLIQGENLNQARCPSR